MSFIATASNELKFHTWPEGELHKCYRPSNFNEGAIKDISWKRNGLWTVLVPSFGAAEIISIKDNALHTIEEIHHPVCATFQNSVKNKIAIGTLDGQILVYDTKSTSITKRFPKINSSIFKILYNAKDTLVIVVCTNGDILLFNDINTTLESSFLIPKSKTVSAINFHRTKRNMFAAGSEEGCIAAWDINTNTILSYVHAHQAPITSIAFSPIRSDLLMTSGLDNKFSCYDILTNKPIIQVKVTNSITALDFSFCGTYLGLGTQNGNIALYDARKFSKPVSTFLAHESKQILHMSFQKVPTLSNDEHDDFDLLTSAHSKIEEQEFRNDKVDFFYSDHNKFDTKTCIDVHRKSSVENDDSFLAVLGGEYRGNQSLPKRSGALKSEVPAEKLLPLKPILKNYSKVDKSKTTTPTEYHVCQNDLKKIVQDVMKTELQLQNEKFKKEFAEIVSDMRRFCFDLQISVVKEFANLEEKINKSNTNL